MGERDVEKNSSVPIIVFAYNRPKSLHKFLESLKPHCPEIVYFHVDGPRDSNDDLARVLATRQIIDEINWIPEVRICYHDTNIGLRLAIECGMQLAFQAFDKIIVCEDDIILGAEFLNFMTQNLSRYESNLRIGHISGYNNVPREFITDPTSAYRFSIFPESYAWATWKRAWKHYDPSLAWGSKTTWKTLSRLTQSKLGGIVWKNHFYEAYIGRLNSWAFRWVASLWQNNLLCITPNRNLILYTGRIDGTHTFRESPWLEIPIEVLPMDTPSEISRDIAADKWTQQNVFYGTFRGLLILALGNFYRYFKKNQFLTAFLLKKVEK
jgi:hypothetical protein